MTNNGIVKIHGKDYMTVAGRVELAHEGNEKSLSITTELISSDPVLFKATVVTFKGTFTGYSAAYGDPKKPIEKQSPYEVAETSAVGRALGFAGYGVVEGIASADEIVAATSKQESAQDAPESNQLQEAKICSAHDQPVQMLRGQSKSKLDDNGNPKIYWWHKNSAGQICFGDGFK